jgi:hypothetical protein
MMALLCVAFSTIIAGAQSFSLVHFCSGRFVKKRLGGPDFPAKLGSGPGGGVVQIEIFNAFWLGGVLVKVYAPRCSMHSISFSHCKLQKKTGGDHQFWPKLDSLATTRRNNIQSLIQTRRVGINSGSSK